MKMESTSCCIGRSLGTELHNMRKFTKQGPRRHRLQTGDWRRCWRLARGARFTSFRRSDCFEIEIRNIANTLFFVLLYFRICARRVNFSHLETLGFGYSSRQDAKNAKFGNLFYFAPLRLCGKCSDSFWLRLRRARLFVCFVSQIFIFWLRFAKRNF